MAHPSLLPIFLHMLSVARSSLLSIFLHNMLSVAHPFLLSIFLCSAGPSIPALHLAMFGVSCPSLLHIFLHVRWPVRPCPLLPYVWSSPSIPTPHLPTPGTLISAEVKMNDTEFLLKRYVILRIAVLIGCSLIAVDLQSCTLISMCQRSN